MHSFLHGIRRSFLRPVWAPLQRCLPLLALLKCCPEEGDLLPFLNLNQPSGYGDLLQSGDETKEGDLPPQSGDAHEEGDLLPYSGDEEGDLLPQSGDENGEGIPPSQGNETAVLCDLQPPIKWQLGNTLGILSPKSNGVASAFSVVFHEVHAWSTTLCCPVKALQHGHFMKMFEADAVLMLSLSVAQTFVFDPSGLSCLYEDFLSACQPAAMTSHRRSTFAADHQHLLDVDAAPTLMVNKYADTSVHAHIHVGQTKVLQEVLGGHQPGFRLDDKSPLADLSYGEANCRFHENQCKVLLLMAIIQDDAVLYGHSLWFNGRHSGEGAATYFLIPLRGSISVQWNDEDFDEDVAALKMKTKRRMMVLRLLYLMKDLLDPG